MKRLSQQDVIKTLYKNLTSAGIAEHHQQASCGRIHGERPGHSAGSQNVWHAAAADLKQKGAFNGTQALPLVPPLPMPITARAGVLLIKGTWMEHPGPPGYTRVEFDVRLIKADTAKQRIFSARHILAAILRNVLMACDGRR